MVVQYRANPAFPLPTLRWEPSPNYSARGSAAINLIVIHDTEGSFNGTVEWFGGLASHVSAHLILKEDGSEAVQMVGFRQKAWACCWYNSRSINIEMAGFEKKGFSEEEWHSAAAITAYLCHRYKIPVRWAKAGSGAGIAQHRDLGRLGGGHTDATSDEGKWLWFMGLVAKTFAENKWPIYSWGRE